VLRGEIEGIFEAEFGGADADNVVPNVFWKVKGPNVGDNRGCTLVTEVTTASLKALFKLIG
jgi:hypothetical protein